MEGIVLAPATANPGAGEAYEDNVVWINSANSQPVIGSSTIVTSALLPYGTATGDYLTWNQSQQKYVTDGNIIMNNTGTPKSISGASTISGGQLIASDKFLGNAFTTTVGATYQDTTIQGATVVTGQNPGTNIRIDNGIAPVTDGINLCMANKPLWVGSTIGNMSSGAIGDMLTSGGNNGTISWKNWSQVNANSTINVNNNDIVNVSSLKSGALSFTPTVRSAIEIGVNYAGSMAGLTVQNNNVGSSASANIYLSGTNATETTDYSVMGKNGTNYNSGSDYLSEKAKALYIGNADESITIMPSFLTGTGATHLTYENGTKAISVCNDGSISLGTVFNATTQQFEYEKGASGQVLMSQGNAPAVWSTISGGGGGGVSEVTANFPLSVINGTTTPDISLNVSSIQSTLVKTVESSNGSLTVTQIPGVEGITADISLSTLGAGGTTDYIKSVTFDTYGRITGTSAYDANSPITEIYVGGNNGLSIVSTGTTRTITNIGVLDVTAGNSYITIGGTSSNPTVSNNGVLTVGSSGLGITIGGTANNPTVATSAIVNANAGAGIQVSTIGANTVEITNTGVTSLQTNPSFITGLSTTNNSITGNLEIFNTGVLDLTAGSGISITGDKSNYTISASGGGTGNIYQDNVGQTVGEYGQTFGTGTTRLNIALQNAFGAVNTTAIGSGALNFGAPPTTEPIGTVAIGGNAGTESGTSGDQTVDCVYIGNSAGQQVVFPSETVAVGAFAGSGGRGFECVYMGAYAGENADTDGGVFIGNRAGRGGIGNNTVAIGKVAFDGSTGQNNVAIGYSSGIYVNGDDNLFLGVGLGAGTDGNPVNYNSKLLIGNQYAFEDYLNGQMGNSAGDKYTLGFGTNNPTAWNPANHCFEVNGDTKTGDLVLTNATLDTTSGGNSGQHLRININGTYYKLALLQD